MKIRNSLVVFQFVVSIILIISSIAVYKQFIYMQNKDLGFDKENIVIIIMDGLFMSTNNLSYEERESRFATLRQEVLKHANVINASLTSRMPGTVGWWGILSVHPEGATPGTRYSLNVAGNDYAYLDVFGLEMAAGRNFRTSLTIPQTREGVIINEKAANQLGLKNPVGKYLTHEDWIRITNSEGEDDWEKKEVQTMIIGVFKDFHNDKLHVDINPTIYLPIYKGMYNGNFLAVRFLPGNIPDNIAFLEKTWNKFTNEPFKYSFFNKELEALYNKEKKLAQVFTFFTILAIFIACLGIFGLAAFTAEQRTKEIGIRKVLGASIRNIVEILSKIYLKLLIVAILIACPLGYIVMAKWLQNFAFRTNIGATIFILTALITTIIVLTSVSYHSVKAAMANPAKSLKYE